MAINIGAVLIRSCAPAQRMSLLCTSAAQQGCSVLFAATGTFSSNSPFPFGLKFSPILRWVGKRKRIMAPLPTRLEPKWHGQLIAHDISAYGGVCRGASQRGKRNGKEKPGQRPSLPVPAKPARNQSGPRSGPGPQARSPPTKQSR